MREVLDELDSASGKKKLQLVVERMVEAAIGGDMAACREIADRLEGKPAQTLTHENSDGTPLSIVIATAIPARDDDQPAQAVH